MSFLRRVVIVAAVTVLVVNVFEAATVVKRSDTSNHEQEPEPCTGRTPCGWAIYNRTLRYVDYFMKNRCYCEGDKKCIRDDDDITIAAFVYRCKVDELGDEESKS